MAKKFLFVSLLLGNIMCNAQLNPAITSFLQNNTKTGTYYVSGNSTALSTSILVNCQKVEYSANNVYIHTTGVPAYPTGPFLDGNTSLATNQNAIFKFPLVPVKNTGTPTATTGGNIGVFINGVALFDYRDGVAWNNTTNALCGGPGNPACPGGMGATQAWNRDAIPAEMKGFDCSKAHPAMGNYHHHQNPSAFKLDLNLVSTICNLYDADGLYTIDSTKHSPLIGFAYDGFPIYGAYGYKNVNGTGGFVRMKSSYSLSTNTSRANGPAINQVVGTQTMINGYFREDYVYTPTSASTPEYLDEHNGRFCITPEYPAGTYCYFATVDAKWNSAYPYVVGPTFYGTYADRKITSVTETTTNYNPPTSIIDPKTYDLNVNILPNPSNDFIAIQIMGLNKENLDIALFDASGKLVQKSTINAGATNTYLDTKTLYAGHYVVNIIGATFNTTRKVVITK
jgi:YHYH protein/Secretion system C-terminal sorting domain